MLKAIADELEERALLSVRVALNPSVALMADIERASKGKWLASLALYGLGIGLSVLLIFLLIGKDPTVEFVLSASIGLVLLAFAWALSCQGLGIYLLRHRPNLFEPLLYLTSTALLLLFVVAGLLSVLPQPADLLSAIPLVYIQVIIVWAIRSIGKIGIVQAMAISVISDFLALVVAFSLTAIASGMPGFFESGTLF